MDETTGGFGLRCGDPVTRAAAAAAMGLGPGLPRGTVAALEAMVDDDPDPRAASAALGALVRRAGRSTARRAWRTATVRREGAVRRRAAELAPAIGGPAPWSPLLRLLDDGDPSVAEAAAWALGEVATGEVPPRAVGALAAAARDHPEALVRESAVAALGAAGDPTGLGAILAACRDRPAVRRRAVLALAPFDGPEVEAALADAARDPDWQVRQAAEDLTA